MAAITGFNAASCHARLRLAHEPQEQSGELQRWTEPDGCVSEQHPLRRDHHLVDGQNALESPATWLQPPSPEMLQRFRMLLEALESNKTLRVITYGGSMPGGTGCLSPAASGIACAYSRRISHWLQQSYPSTQIIPDNRAIGGATSASALPQLSGWACEYATLVLLDFSINDLYDQNLPLHVAATEVWMRQVTRAPNAVLVLLDIFPGFADHPLGSRGTELRNRKLELALKYGVPVMRYASLVPTWYTVEKNQTASQRAAHQVALRPHSPWWSILSPNGRNGDFGHFRHCGWLTHVLIADAFSEAWLHWSSSAMDLRQRSVPDRSLSMQLPPPETPDSMLSRLAVCDHPKSMYGAPEPGVHQVMNETESSDGWSFFEDRPGKPGYIATTVGSRLRLPLRFGQQHVFFQVKYLQGYDINGTAKLTLRGRADVHHAEILNAKRSGTGLVTQSSIFTGLDTGHPKLPWRIIAGSHRTLEIELITPGKFKVASVHSC